MKSSILIKTIGIIAFLLFQNSGLFAQNAFKNAEKAYQNMSYVEAISNYETYLLNQNETGDDHFASLKKLGISYKKVQDHLNAERIFRELFKTYGKKIDLDSDLYLCYAQILANNGNYKESQKYYSKYGEKQKQDLRGKKFTVAYMDNSEFYKDSSLYKVSFLNTINTRHSDFSPMFYKDGIVFVSSRDEGGLIKRVFNQNQTPFLDLFVYNEKEKLEGPKDLQVASLGSSENINKDSENSEFGKFENGNIEEFSKKINSKYHEGPISFFEGYNKVIFTRNNYSKGKAKKSSTGINMLKLYIADKQGNQWANVTELPFNSDEYSCGHPALSPDNKVLYFSSDMPGGYGGTDIYKISYSNGKWGKPINLGKNINTEGNELFPYCDENSNLYFSSDGHAGLGGLDVFFIEIDKYKVVGDAQNLGSPINSSKDDFGFIANGDRSKGYFSSNRLRGFSDDNIYAFEKGCKKLELLVYDNESKAPLSDADVRIVKNGLNKQLLITNTEGKIEICLETGSDFDFKVIKEGYEIGNLNFGTLSTKLNSKSQLKIFLEKSKRPLVKGLVKSELHQTPLAGTAVTLKNEKDGSTETIITGEDGRFEFQPKKDGKYNMVAEKDNYATNTENLGKVKQAKRKNYTVEQNFGMIGAGDIFRIDNIYYDYGKYEIRPEAKLEIETKLIPILKKFSSIKIEIRSHTDSRSDEQFNLELSEKRANEVFEFLLSKGINNNRIIPKGYGEYQLINNCKDDVNCPEFYHQENRRTEFKILAVKEQLGLR